MDGVTLSDIKTSLDTLVTAVDTLTKSNKDRDEKIDSLLSKIAILEKIVDKKESRICILEQKVSDLELNVNEQKRYSLKNNVIIKGLAVTKPPRAYATVASEPAPMSANTETEVEPVRESAPDAVNMFTCVRSQVLDFLRKTGLPLLDSDICAAHELRKGPKDTVPPLVVRFTHTSTKQDVMFAKKSLTGDGVSNIYINDQMTVTNGRIFYKARGMKKSGDLFAVWTRLGKVFVKRSVTSSPTWIRTEQELLNLSAK